MRNYIFLILVIIAIIGAILLVREKKVSSPASLVTSTSTVVAFGDSLVYGTGSTSGNDFVSVLGKMLNHDIVNMGVPGDTTAEGLGRIDQLIKQKPDLVLVLLGGNDALGNIPKEQTFSNLGKIIDRLQANNIKIVLLGIQGGLFNIADPYEAEFKKLAEDKKVILVPNVLEGIFGSNELMSDPVHPNDAGYKKIAEKVYSYLK
ncbi:MAG: lipolytic enzyme family [Candidatus Nomurabacteria bacterium]|nr:lipolytic enzyme family [Candidatus Nomurabacteria bacterium]